ncbi:hypothetical protein HJC23_002217 [Cyclotella cryptica]|uniref:HMG box domain-containing protein n=1 Tax=Cyclotella cryptica TaxID=29204 RepID=A0ABD3P515_9STRA|eukprot:CCRYP_017870-RA/>CCRYP_017870-RA protein AED:0.15 eAED:-0.05 QI:0/-1/0/1/-1/1/1/0/344
MYQHHSPPNHALGTRESLKPKRPLTCYGIFSILERNYIWQHDHKAVPPNVSTNAFGDPYAATRPARYRGIVLPSNWFVVGMNRKKRSEYKHQSKVSFQELSKTIAQRWRSADMETKMYCELIAANELERYRRDMAAYEETNTEEGDKAKATKTCNPCEAPLKECKCDSVEDHSVNTLNRYDVYDQCMNGIMDVEFCRECTPGANNSVIESQHGQLSDYLPDDRKEALELVGYNYGNILSGEELERAFDDDDDDDDDVCTKHDITYFRSVNESASSSRAHSDFSGQHYQPKDAHESDLASLSYPERQKAPEMSTASSLSSASRNMSSDMPSMFGAFQQWYTENRS